VVEGVVAQGITDERQRARRNLLHNLNTFQHTLKGDPRLAALAQCEKEAYDLILGDAGKVFELSQEKDELRDRYGRNTFGQFCLMARRLVERGVPYVTINYKGWDTHKENLQTMRRKLPRWTKPWTAPKLCCVAMRRRQTRSKRQPHRQRAARQKYAAAADGKNAVAARRFVLGTLPAIPFEVVAE